VKIPGQLCFSGQAQVAKKSWTIKIQIQYSEFRAPSVFQGKRKLLKNPECKRYSIQWKFQGNSVFQGKRKSLKNPECKKYIQYTKNFQDNSIFQGKRKLLKNPEWWKIRIQYSEKFQGKLCFSGQAQAAEW